MDLKVVAAVFGSLVIAAGLFNAGYDIPDAGSIEFPELPSTVGSFKDIVPQGQPDTEVDAHFVASEPFEMDAEAGSLRLTGLSSMSVSDLELTASGEVALQNFDGTVNIDRNTTISGSASSISSDSFDLEGGLQIDEKAGISQLTASDVSTAGFSLKVESGSVRSGQVSSSVGEGTEVAVGALEGDITVYPGNGSVALEGSTSSLSAGEIDLG